MIVKNALVIIDVQAGLFKEDDLPARANEVIDCINDLTDWARKGEVPVIWVQHETDGGELTYGSDGWQLHAGLVSTQADMYIRKTTPDSFLRTPLLATLESLAVDQLIICGYASEFCVDTTVRRAAGFGYPVTLVADGHTTHDKAHLSGEQISYHENQTLPNITSFGVSIQATSARELLLRRETL